MTLIEKLRVLFIKDRRNCLFSVASSWARLAAFKRFFRNLRMMGAEGTVNHSIMGNVNCFDDNWKIKFQSIRAIHFSLQAPKLVIFTLASRRVPKNEKQRKIKSTNKVLSHCIAPLTGPLAYNEPAQKNTRRAIGNFRK